MIAFTQACGTAAPLARADVDTDAIIPQQWLITTSREGLGAGLFANWRYRPGTMQPDPGFVLNQPRFSDPVILVAGANFGCGSSREHAVWALLDYGIRAVVAPSFGTIFRENALNNGLLAVALDESVVASFLEQLEEDWAYGMAVDLLERQVIGPDGNCHSFSLESERRSALLAGRDQIATTLAFAADIEAFQRCQRAERPWLWPGAEPPEQGGS